MKKRNKKVLIVLLSTIVSVVLCFHIAVCFMFNDGVFWYMYFGWKEVEIDKAGTIKIPDDWMMKYDDENKLFYFVDENDEPKMVETYLETYRSELVEDGKIGNEEIINKFGKITEIKNRGGNNLSNGAFFAEAKYVSDNQDKQGFVLKVAYSGLAKTFVIVDDQMSKYQVFKIAHSSKP